MNNLLIMTTKRFMMSEARFMAAILST